MTEAYCLDCLEVTLKSYITPDRSPETCTVARNYCDAVLEDVYRKSLLLCCNLSFEVRVSINFALLNVECAYYLTVDVNEDS